MKKAWRRFLAGICTVSLLMTSTGVSVMADEDESIFTDLSEDVSVIEQSEAEEQGAAPDEEEDNFEVIYEEEDEENQDFETDIPSQDMDTSESIEESISDESLTTEAEILDQSVAEEVVGDAVTSMDWTYINPVYDHLITEEDLKPLNNEAEDSGDWYIDSLKVRFFVKDQMEARADTIAVHYRTTNDYSQGQTMYRLMEGFVRAETVASYTGRGDYLLFHLAGWKGHISVFPSDDGYYNYTMTYAMTYFTDIAQENEVTEEVNRLINFWNLYEKSTYEKVKIVYDYLVQNVTFSNEFTFEDSSAYAALINKYADCYGFYSAMCRILQECSVNIRAITGKNNIGTDNETKCAWNAVKIGSRYFNADPALEAEYYSDDQDYSYFLTKEDTSGTFHFQDEDLGGYRRYVSPFSETDYVALEKPPVWIWSQDCSTATVTFNESLPNEISLNADVSTQMLDDSEITFTATVLFNGENFSTTTTKEIGDEYGEPVWEWEGYFEATAVFTNNSSGDIIRKTVIADSEFQVNDENTGAGTMTYTATVTFGNKEYSDSRTIETIQKTYICSTREEIIQKGREAYRNHETRFMLLWPENIGITLDDIEELREGINDYTGNPLEGDYLRWSTYSSMNRETGTITKDGIEYYKWVIENCYYTTLEQENELSQWIDDRIAGFGFTNETTEFEKFITIYNYIWDNVRYDHDYKLFSNSAYSAGINGSACCLGYSNLLYRMLLEVGIDSRVIGGNIDGIILILGDFDIPTTRHAWNIVRIGDLYYETDLTIDAGYSKDESSPYAYLTYDNCLRASLRDHVRDEEYNTEEFKTTYPMSDLSYPVVEKYSVGEGVTCNVEDGVLYISGTGKIKDIPFNVENRPWTTHIRKAVIEEGVSEIGDCVFKDSPDEFKEVVIAGSVKVIGENSFAFCQELEAVDIGEGVRKIEDGAFLGCDRNLTRIEIPGTVREIGTGAFQGCENLSEVALNDGIRIIDEHAFFTETVDSLTQITIPGSVIEIGNQAFGYYFNEGGSHTTIDPIPGFKIYGYDGSAAETYAEQNGFEFISLGTYDKKDISACSVSLHDTELVYDGVHKRPEVIVKDGDDILEKKYDYTVMYRNNLNVGTAEILVNGVGKYEGSKTLTFLITKADPVLTFAEDNISKTNLDDAFTNDLNKKTDGAVTFSSSNTAVAKVDEISGLVTIQGLGTAVITVTAEEGNNYRASSASYELTVIEGRTDLSNYTVLLSNYEYFCDGTAKEPDVRVLNLGNADLTCDKDFTVTYINNKKAGTATVKVNGIGRYRGEASVSFDILRKDPELKFEIDSICKTTGDSVFINTLTNMSDGVVTFTSSNTAAAEVDSISGLATLKGPGMAVITAAVGETDYYEAGSISYKLSVISEGEGPVWLEKDGVLYIYGTGDIQDVDFNDTENSRPWSGRFTRLVIEEGVTGIGECAFKDCIWLKEVTIPGSVKVIKQQAFIFCSRLESLEIGDGVEKIGQEAFLTFGNNETLTRLVIPGSVKEIGANAFYGYANLSDIQLEEGIRVIGKGAFKGPGSNSALTQITIPGSVVEIGDKAVGYNGQTPVSGFKVQGYNNSAAETYAEQNGFEFVSLGEIPAKDISECTVLMTDEEYSYDGTEKTPDIKVKDGDSVLDEQNDYTITYRNNINAGTAEVLVKGVGIYKGTKTLTFLIAKADPVLTFAEDNISKTNIDKAFTNDLNKKTDGTITFSSSNTDVAKVDESSGLVTIQGIGTAVITATAAEGDNYRASSASYTLTVIEGRKDISDCTVILPDEELIYDGKVKTPDVTVKDGDSVLEKQNDYTITYRNNINAGTAEVLVKGVGIYKGTKTLTFLIAKADPVLTFAEDNISKANLDEAFTNDLNKETDGAVTFSSSNTDVAKVDENSGLVTIKGIGTATITANAAAGTNYKEGSNSYTLTVVDGRKDLSECTITLSATSYTYNGSEIKPTVTVKDGSTELKLSTDYSVSYANNKDSGTATVKVTGTGIYKGENVAEFTISKASPILTFASESVSKTVLDEPFTNVLTKTTDGTVTFNSSDESLAAVDSESGLVTIKGVGTATITASAAEGTNYKSGSASYKIEVSAMSIKGASVGGLSRSYGYSGKAYTPAVTVKVNGVNLVKDEDFEVKYENNIEPGTATITISGIGNYTGTRIRTFEIVDCVSKVESGKTYQLIPKNNSSTAVSSFGGRMVNNTKVYITDRSSSEAMKFKAVRNTDGTWKFINAKCDLALAVQQNSSSLGAGLVLYDQTTRTAQNWKFSKKSDNSFAIMNAVTGYSIAMSDSSAARGTTLSMAETASNGLQRFYLVETDPVKVAFSGTKTVRASKDKNFGLNIASSSKTDGANVNLYKYSNVNAKKFKILYSGGGYYRLVNVNSGLVLTVKGNTKTSGANVIQRKWAGESGQRWKITKNSDGTVTLKNALGTVLHLNGNKAANGTNVLAKSAATTGAQKWYLQ